MIIRPTSTPAGSPSRPAARRSRCTGAPRSRPTPARRTGTRSPRLKQHVSIPVLGNGDIWEAADALEMVEQTGVDGVVIGRGCLGRPWLFRDLADAFAGRPTRTLPTLGEVATMVRRHAELLVGLLRRGARLRRPAQAHGLVLQGLPGRRGAPPGARSGGLQLRRTRSPPGAARPATCLSRRPSWARRAAAGFAAGPRWRCPRAGSTTPSGGRSRSGRRRARDLGWLTRRDDLAGPRHLAARPAVGGDDGRPRRRRSGPGPRRPRSALRPGPVVGPRAAGGVGGRRGCVPARLAPEAPATGP